MIVRLKAGLLIVTAENEAEKAASTAWIKGVEGHVFVVTNQDSQTFRLNDLGPRLEACREPINVMSRAADPGVQLSNFAHTPFQLDGRQYASVDKGTDTKLKSMHLCPPYLNLRGMSIVYDARKKEIVVNKHHAPAPLFNGKLRLIVYVDRTALEIFVGDGLSYIPMPFVPKTDDKSVSVDMEGGKAKMNALQVYKLKSIWSRK